MTASPSNLTRLFVALCGGVGPIVLTASFVMNPSPPAGLTTAQLVAWAAPRAGILLIGGWTQGIGSALVVIFALGLVELGGGAGLAGRVSGLAGAVILAVSLVEVTFYLAAAQSILTGDTALGLIANGLTNAVHHVFLIAPALLLPLGAVILTTRVLPRAFGWSGLAIGAVLQTLGVVGLMTPLQPLVDAVLIVQALWFIAAGAVIAIGGGTLALGAPQAKAG